MHTSLTALEKLAAPTEPTEPAAGGREESPIFTVILFTGKPSASEAVCATIVCVPVPRSDAASSIVAFTSLLVRVSFIMAEELFCLAG